MLGKRAAWQAEQLRSTTDRMTCIWKSPHNFALINCRSHLKTFPAHRFLQILNSPNNTTRSLQTNILFVIWHLNPLTYFKILASRCFLHILFANICNLCLPLQDGQHVVRTYKTYDKIILTYIFIFIVLEFKQVIRNILRLDRDEIFGGLTEPRNQAYILVSFQTRACVFVCACVPSFSKAVINQHRVELQ